MVDFLQKDEYDTAYNMIEAILTQSVDEIELTDTIPSINDISDSNKVFKGKLSILFVDMRKSTDLTDELKSKKMVKIYRSFIRLIVQAIRYCDGQSRQFAGDGVMGVFQNSIESENLETSGQKAVKAARYILTLIDYCLNPLLKEHLGEIAIGCGIGISTGTIMATKVGMRGKEADDTTENEMGIVWVGSTTNYASRFCSLALPREIYIDDNTYGDMSINDKVWRKETRVKGTKSFTGYIAKDFYLDLPDELDIKPVVSDQVIEADMSFVQSIFNETEERSLQLIDEISKKSAELSMALESIKKREEQARVRESQINQKESQLSQWRQQIQDRQAAVDAIEEKTKNEKYNSVKYIFSKTHCKDNLVREMGKDFWMDLIDKAYAYGADIGKSIDDVTSDLDCYLVRIYLYCFSMYEEAYDALCIQAERSSWLNSTIVYDAVKKSGHWARLKGILEKRVNPSGKKDYYDALQKLKDMGY